MPEEGNPLVDARVCPAGKVSIAGHEPGEASRERREIRQPGAISYGPFQPRIALTRFAISSTARFLSRLIRPGVRRQVDELVRIDRPRIIVVDPAQQRHGAGKRDELVMKGPFPPAAGIHPFPDLVRERGVGQAGNTFCGKAVDGNVQARERACPPPLSGARSILLALPSGAERRERSGGRRGPFRDKSTRSPGVPRTHARPMPRIRGSRGPRPGKGRGPFPNHARVLPRLPHRTRRPCRTCRPQSSPGRARPWACTAASGPSSRRQRIAASDQSDPQTSLIWSRTEYTPVTFR